MQMTKQAVWLELITSPRRLYAWTIRQWNNIKTPSC